MEQLDVSTPRVIPGDIAWIALAAGIISYDVFAVLSKKAETMSSAIWRSLAHPVKSPLAAGIWLSITWHLFVNPRARAAYASHFDTIRKLKNAGSQKISSI